MKHEFSRISLRVRHFDGTVQATAEWTSPQRISVIGTSGSGKTTLAREISQHLTIPHIELDYLHWEPNWLEVPNDVFQKRVSQALSGNAWVVDGNYGIVRDIVWGRADTVVWLDYSLSVVISLVVWRTFQRVVKQQEVCNDNRETWKTTIRRDSVILWALQTYDKNRRQYALLLQKSEYGHLNIVHLRSPTSAQNWLSLIH